MNTVDFATGEPGNFDHIPSELLASLAVDYSNNTFFNYCERKGLPSLRQTYIERYSMSNTSIEQVLVVHGTLTALELVIKAFRKSLNKVVVERYAFWDALNLFRFYELPIIELPRDEAGHLDSDALVNIVDENTLLYLVSSLNNPDGLSLSSKECRQITEICLNKNVICIEDEVYKELFFDARTPESLYEIATSLSGHEHRVCRVHSLSKSLIPGMRICFMEGPPQFIDTVAMHKVDYGTSPILSQIAQRALSDTNNLNQCVASLRNKLSESYRITSNLCTSQGFKFKPQHGGYFLWLQLPNGTNSNTLLQFAQKQGVSFFPGSCFSIAENSHEQYIRLCHGFPHKDNIDLGVKRLLKALDEYLCSSPSLPVHNQVTASYV